MVAVVVGQANGSDGPDGPDGPDAATSASGGSALQSTAEPLRVLAIRRGQLRVGTAVTAGALADEPAYRDTAAREFNSVTLEFQMGWKHVERVRGQRDWAAADAVVSFAQQNTQAVRAGLLWHNGLPAWLDQGLRNGTITSAQFRELARRHVTDTVSRYRGRVQSWDVINEPLNDDGTLRNSLLRQHLGPNFIADAFRWARAADPDAKLYVNDYSTERTNSKSTALYNLVRNLRDQGVPIDGVGFQSHITLTTDLSSVPGNLRRFADLGVDVAVTELDVRIPLPADANELATQARQYDSVVRACLSLVRCVSVTVWGFSDSHSWVPGTFQGMGAATLLDEQLRPKPAYTTVQATLAHRDFDGTAVAMHSQRCLDAPAAHGQVVNQWACTESNANQRFRFQWVAPGVNTIRNLGSGRCLQIEGASTANHAPVVQATCTTAALSQQFRLQRVTGLGTDRDFQLRPVHNGPNARCLDVLDASSASGAAVQQYTCHPTSAPTQRNQVWRLSGASGHL